MKTRKPMLLARVLVTVVVTGTLLNSAAATPAIGPSGSMNSILLDRQRQALSAMPSIAVSYHDKGTVRLIEGQTGIVLGEGVRALRVGESGKSVLGALRDVLMVNGEEELLLLSNRSRGSTQVLTFAQSIKGIPVIGGVVGVGLDGSTGHVHGVKAEFLPDKNLPRVPTITRSEATEAAKKAVYGLFFAAPESAQFLKQPSLAYIGSNDLVDRPALVWVVQVSYLEEGGGVVGERDVWIDALSSEYLGSRSNVRHLNRTVHTAGGAAPPISNLPSGTTLLFTEGNAGGTNTQAVVAYGNVGLANDAWTTYLWATQVPNLNIVVQYAPPMVGAAAEVNGHHFLIFGAGDSATLPGSMDTDVVAHEYGHALLHTRKPTLMTGTTESAALHEAYADYSAALTDIKIHGGNTSSTTWEIAPIFLNGQVIRSWSVPKGAHASRKGFDWYPTAQRASQWYYENSTIIGHAHYLLAHGGRNASFGQPGIPDIVVPGIGWHSAALVFAFALDDFRMTGNPTFLDLRKATEAAASGMNPTLLDATKRAWDAVGVGYACTTGPATPNMTLEDFLCRGRYRMTWNAVPGATHYYAEKVPAGYPWSLAAPVVDANVTSCTGAVGTTTRFRLQACNGCGCSEFTPAETVQWYPQCP